MMRKYRVADAHCDTVSGIYREPVLYQNEGHLDICRMREYQNWLQFFAVWVDPAIGFDAETKRCDEIIDTYYTELEENEQYIVHTTNAAGINKAWADNKIAAFLTVEGGGSIGSDLQRVQRLYDRGVRLITLTWNHNNTIASGAGDPSPSYGLTDFGRQVVDEMNRLGMIIDVSHLSDRGFWDLAAHMQNGADKPFVATHSNARAVCAHPRNLTDAQFLHLKRIGGVAGMNLCPLFVAGGTTASIDGIIRHIEHFMSLGGEDHVGLGCDFDGIDNALEDLRGAEQIDRLLDRLAAMGYSDGLIEKIAYQNFIGIIDKICG